VLRTFSDESIDLFVTSPPYNIGVKYHEYHDNKEQSEYLDALGRIFSEVKRVLRPDGSVFLNIGSTNSNPWIAFEVGMRLKELFLMQNRIIWVKSISVGDVTYGHFKPINSPRFTNHTFEEIFHFTKDGRVKIDRLGIGVPYMDKGNLKRRNNDVDLRCRGNCWFIPYETINSKTARGDHPAVFPEKLADWCIRLAGFDRETVVCDPFLGSGTTLIAARKLGINGIGIEMDSKYCRESYNRLAQAA